MPLRCATMNPRTSAEYVFCTGKNDGKKKKKVKKTKSEPKGTGKKDGKKKKFKIVNGRMKKK